MQHAEVLKSGAGLVCLETSVQIFSPLAAFYSSSWNPPVSYSRWFNTYQMSLLASAKADNRPLLQLPTFSATDTQIIYYTFPYWSYYILSLILKKKYEAWNQGVKHSNFASQITLSI